MQVRKVSVPTEELHKSVDCLDILLQCQRDLNLEFVIIGATARDLLFLHVHKRQPFRATSDVDVAVSVQSWTDYDAVIDYLVRNHDMTKMQDRLRVTKNDLALDVLPFGEIANQNGQLIMPEGTASWSVIGFEEVCKSALEFTTTEGDRIKVASLAGVVILKMIAWGENPQNRPQDPIDVCQIMMSYHDAVGQDLYDTYFELIDDDFDHGRVGAQILGIHMADILGDSPWWQVIVRSLDSELEGEMSNFIVAMGVKCEREYSVRYDCLRALRKGLNVKS